MDQAILEVDVYQYTRKFLLNKMKLIEIDSDILFPGVIAETAILLMQKEKNSSYNLQIKQKNLDNNPRVVNIKDIV